MDDKERIAELQGRVLRLENGLVWLCGFTAGTKPRDYVENNERTLAEILEPPPERREG